MKIGQGDYAWGELKISHEARVSSMSVDGHILMVGSWDKTATAHDLRYLLND